MLKNLTIFLLVLSLIASLQAFNTSVCSTFQFHDVYYKLNQGSNKNQYSSWSYLSDQDVETDKFIYNYCSYVEYYCEQNNKIINASLIQKQTCHTYQQESIQLIQQGNITSGIKINYQYIDTSTEDDEDNSTIKQTDLIISLSYVCEETNSEIWVAGCPEVEQSTIFHYFNENQLAFTITIQIIGIIFMVLGVYIYRFTIVLISGLSIFIVLLAIQANIVFQPGVPSNFITIIIIINGVTSIFTGYVFGYFPKVGLFFLGAWIGFIISLTLNNIAFYFIVSQPANLTLWIVMPILCVIFGLLSFFIRKVFIIFATSLIGAYVSLRALSWHLGTFPNEFLLSRKYQYGLEGPVEWQFYLYVIALIILTASSSALQYWLFKKKLELQQDSSDIDEHFQNMEKKIESKRQNLVDFQNVFRESGKQRSPKRLKRRQQSDDSEFQASQKMQEDSSSGSQIQLPDIPDENSNIKNKLTKKLLNKNSKK